MDSELDVVRQINKLAGQARPVDLMMDLITRYGHWAFLIYGMLLWFAPGKNQKHRRESCVAAFLAVCLCSVISLAVGKLWHRGRLLPGTGRFGILQGTKRMRLFRAIMP